MTYTHFYSFSKINRSGVTSLLLHPKLATRTNKNNAVTGYDVTYNYYKYAVSPL